MPRAAQVLSVVVVAALGLGPAACRSNEADLETEEYAKSTISLDGPATARLVSGSKVQVEGPATHHDKFQHDVYFTATLVDAAGNSVGTATGKLEDWPAGHRGVYKLTGTCTTPAWSRVEVVVSKVTEHVRGLSED